MNLEMVLGFLVVVLTATGMIYHLIKKSHADSPPFLRKSADIERLKAAIELSVEDGSRVHVTLGSADLTDAANPSALAGLDSLHRIGQSSSTSDLPPVCSSGNGAFALLSKDTLAAVASDTNTWDIYDPDQGYLTGVTPMAYAVGAMDVMSEPGVKSNILIGNFGSESGFMTITSEEQGAFTVAASDSIIGLSVFMATIRNVVVGEGLFAIPARLALAPAQLAGLKMQDMLRVIIVAALVIGALFKALGLL
ncbi:MAG: hypothetical protein KBD67_06445 [Anaerolineaceae bacterium]|nr:hypothetical protein [Anaerolineaceae bacterium]